MVLKRLLLPLAVQAYIRIRNSLPTAACCSTIYAWDSLHLLFHLYANRTMQPAPSCQQARAFRPNWKLLKLYGKSCSLHISNFDTLHTHIRTRTNEMWPPVSEQISVFEYCWIILSLLSWPQRLAPHRNQFLWISFPSACACICPFSIYDDTCRLLGKWLTLWLSICWFKQQLELSNTKCDRIKFKEMRKKWQSAKTKCVQFYIN